MTPLRLTGTPNGLMMVPTTMVMMALRRATRTGMMKSPSMPMPPTTRTTTMMIPSMTRPIQPTLTPEKRFTDLRLSRGYLPIVALGHPAAGNLSPGITSPTSSPTSTKGRKGSPKGKSKGGSPKGKPNNYKFQPAPMKSAEPKARAKAALRCLRCGQPGYFASNCPVPSKAAGTKRLAPANESVAMLENAHVTFQDGGGHERHDVAMLDPGASALLSGYGPALRYLHYLSNAGYPIDQIQFYSCRHKFHFGGDGESWCHWIMEMPMCVAGSYGRAQVFLLKGETPMLCGRPIIEALGLVMDFQRRQVKFKDTPWRDATIGLHGEYLLPFGNQTNRWNL